MSSRWPRAAAMTAAIFVIVGAQLHAQRARLAGFSSRVLVDAEGAWLTMTIEPGSPTRSVWISAAGPGLSAFGLTGTIPDPQLEVWNQTGARVAINDNRPDALVGSFGYPILASSPKDAVLLLTLTPGVYTVRAKDVAGSSGVVLLEVSDAAASPRFISFSLAARAESANLVAAVNLSGSGAMRLGAIASGPNLPVPNPAPDPRLSIYNGATLVGSNDDYDPATAPIAGMLLSPLRGNAKNAYVSWSSASSFTMTAEARNLNGELLLEAHDFDTASTRPPVILIPPSSKSLALGEPLTLTTAVGGQFAGTVQWQRDGVDIPGAVGTTFFRSSVTTSDAGSYTAKFTTSVGSTVSPPAVVAVASTVPTFTVQPQSVTVAEGAPAMLSVTASGGSLAYLWRKNGSPIPGATSATLSIAAAGATDAGTYTVVVTNSVGSAISSPATLTVNLLNPGRMVNFSLRAPAGQGDRTLVLGFTLQGTGSKPMVIRGIGPALAGFGVSGVLADPRLAIYAGSTEVMSNDNWIIEDGRSFGAFPLASGSKDAVVSNAFNAASFTAQVSGVGGGTGEAMVELYDAATSNVALVLSNLSARTNLGDGETLIVGFTIAGASAKKLYVRAIGPSLTPFGVGNAHPDPRIELYSGATKMAENDQWIADDGRSAGGFPLTAGSKDAVVSAVLSPAGYTVHVKGMSGTSGVVLIELYQAP